MNPYLLLFFLFAPTGCREQDARAALPQDTFTDATEIQSDTNPPPIAPVPELSKNFKYDLDQPIRNIILEHPRLMEISGLSPGPEKGQLCAVSDEAGVIYFLDAQTGAVLRTLSFRLSGDFEGVEWTGKQLYAVKSDGDIFELEQYEGEQTNYLVYKTPLKKSDDLEGLCFDPSRNALLVVTKGKPENADDRHVYAFDLTTKTLQEKPLFSLSPETIEAARKKKGKDKNKEDQQYFSPSGIAIHPVTGHWYIISSAKRRLAIVDPANFSILDVEKLDKDIFPQPEGICFDASGVLYISSEGKGGNGRLLVFAPQN